MGACVREDLGAGRADAAAGTGHDDGPAREACGGGCCGHLGLLRVLSERSGSVGQCLQDEKVRDGSAVHDDVGAADTGRLVADEEDHGGSDFLGCDHAPVR